MLLIFGWPECSCSNASQVTPVFCSAHSMALTSLIIQAGVFTIYPPKTHLLPSTPALIHPHWLPYSSSSTSQTFQPQGLCTHCSIHHEHSSSLRAQGWRPHLLLTPSSPLFKGIPISEALAYHGPCPYTPNLLSCVSFPP